MVAKVETQIRNYVNEAQRWLSREQGIWIPAARRSFVWENVGHKVTLFGETLGHGPFARYEGPLGEWQAGYTIRGCGKPRQWHPPAPAVVEPAGGYVIRADVEPGGITQVRPLAGALTADAAAGELALFDLDRPGFAAGVFIGLPIERG